MTKRPALLTGAWLAAVVAAVAVGVLTVTLLASSMKDRGPIGEAVATETSGAPAQPATPAETAEPAEPAVSAGAGGTGVRDTFRGEFGEYDVACEGVRASTVAVRPAAGWREVSHEAGPDDDVDAVFTDGVREVEVTVFCNRGKPTLDEIEFDTLGAE